MTGTELRLMREYKNIERKYEDSLMGDLNDKISKFIDEKGYEKYKEQQEISRNIKQLISSIIDYESLEIYCNDFIEELNRFYNNSDNNIHYFDNQEGIIKEVLLMIKYEIDIQMNELESLSYICKIKGYNKTSNNIKFAIKKLNETRETLLKEIILSSTRVYRKLVIEEFESVDSSIKEKIKEIQSYKLDEKIENVHKETQRILDCDKIDSLLKSLNYMPVRQKGSHLIYKKENARRPIPIPQHKALNKELGYGIQRQILKNEQ